MDRNVIFEGDGAALAPLAESLRLDSIMAWELWNHRAALAATPPLLRTLQHCLRCGCTKDRACPEGCFWATPHLCSLCAGEDDVIAAVVLEGQRPTRLRGPGRYHTRTLTRPALHPWAPLCMPWALVPPRAEVTL